MNLVSFEQNLQTNNIRTRSNDKLSWLSYYKKRVVWVKKVSF